MENNGVFEEISISSTTLHQLKLHQALKTFSNKSKENKNPELLPQGRYVKFRKFSGRW